MHEFLFIFMVINHVYCVDTLHERTFFWVMDHVLLFRYTVWMLVYFLADESRVIVLIHCMGAIFFKVKNHVLVR